jgi:hypothetical protein
MIGDGINCTKPPSIDHCASSPCHPGAKCFNFSHKYKCGTCPAGLTGNGIKCTSADVDPCSTNPCFPGVACLTVWKGKRKKAQFACGLCPDGNRKTILLSSWSCSSLSMLAGMVGNGVQCSTTDPCASSPCYRGSSCSPLHDIAASDDGLKLPFSCGKCPGGLVGNGINCRPPQHPCESDPCHKGVACAENGDEYECGECPVGMIGNGFICKDIDDCRTDLCFPDVACTDLHAPGRGYKCGPCPEGTTGNGKKCFKNCKPICQ